MDRKIIHFPVPAPVAARPTDVELERALFLAEAEEGWAMATIPQAAPVQARAVY